MHLVPSIFRNRYVGAHMSVAGGLALAFERIRSVGGTALQIFSHNQRQWAVPELDFGMVDDFARGWREWGAYPLFIHDSYLVNLASTDPEKAKRSVDAFACELQRAHFLQAHYVVTHPGSHLGAGTKQGLLTYVNHLDQALEKSNTCDVIVLLETTAGQGTNLGSSFEELAFIFEHSRYAQKLGICFDTCHAFAAGYDFRTEKGFKDTFDRLDQLIGVERLGCFHLNDSKQPCGSRKDRHEHIGKGEIGERGFQRILQDARFKGVPMILETPKGKELEEDRVNLAVIKRLTEGCAS